MTVLQFAENLTDRAAVHRVRYGMDLNYGSASSWLARLGLSLAA
ncbi:hypothetical protein [Streptomyces sp. NPDC085540]